jgi:hypothetical protein
MRKHRQISTIIPSFQTSLHSPLASADNELTFVPLRHTVLSGPHSIARGDARLHPLLKPDRPIPRGKVKLLAALQQPLLQLVPRLTLVRWNSMDPVALEPVT